MPTPAHKAEQPHRGNSGVAAIEFVFVLPVLLLLWFGMINFSHYIATQRKINSAAELIGDLVTRHETITKSDISDYFNAVTLAVRPLDVTKLRVEVHDFFPSGTAATRRWGWVSPNGRDCPDPSPTPAAQSVFDDGNDIVVAVVCMPYTAPVADYPGFSSLFANLTIDKRVMFRPRQSTTLTCADCGLP